MHEVLVLSLPFSEYDILLIGKENCLLSFIFISILEDMLGVTKFSVQDTTNTTLMSTSMLYSSCLMMQP